MIWPGPVAGDCLVTTHYLRDSLSRSIWNECIRKDWNLTIICPIYKKGNPTKVENY